MPSQHAEGTGYCVGALTESQKIRRNFPGNLVIRRKCDIIRIIGTNASRISVESEDLKTTEIFNI